MANNTAYVADRTANRLYAFDLVAFTTSFVAVGSDPLLCSMKPDGTEVWVANRAGGSISVVDTATLTVTHTITTGIPTNPNQIAFANDGSAAYLAAAGASGVVVISTSTYAVTGTLTTTGTVLGFVVSNPVVGQLAVSTTPGTSSFQMVSIPGGGLSSVVAVGGLTNSGCLAYLANGDQLYIVDGLSPRIWIFDPTTLAPITNFSPTANSMFSGVSNTDSSRFYFTNDTDLYYAAYPGNAVTTVGALPNPGAQCRGMAITGDNTQLVITDTNNNRVYVYSQPGLVLQHTFNGGSNPWGVVCTPRTPPPAIVMIV